MPIHIISIGSKLPEWANCAYREYAKRLPRDWSLQLTEVGAQKRLKNTDLQQVVRLESQKLWQQCTSRSNAQIIALDRSGDKIDSPTLAQHLSQWKDQSKTVQFLIGGPEGIDRHTLNKCDNVWSLSELTFPHPLVRVILVEQIYRAFSIVNKRSYHR